MLYQQLVQYREEEAEWRRRVSELDGENAALKETVRDKNVEISSMGARVATKEMEAASLNKQIVSLQAALRRLQKNHDKGNARQLQQVNQSFQEALKQLEALNKASNQQTDALHEFVDELVGSVEEEESSVVVVAAANSAAEDAVAKEAPFEDEELLSEPEDDVPGEEAMLRAAQAASSVL